MTAGSPAVLYIGGTGTISAACVRRSVAGGMQVYVLNRGKNVKQRRLPAAAIRLTADVHDRDSVIDALAGQTFDSVVDFLSYNAEDAARAIEIFGGRTGQYIHISTASLYRKPILQVPVVESSLRHNEFVRYSRDKIAAEDALMRAYVSDRFPVTIVRPSHTYDEGTPPVPGDWTVFDRIARGTEIVVPGDGTSLWTLTHSDDFAQGLVGLVANPRAIGEAFHITSDDIYTWDQIYQIVAASLGTRAKLVHVPSDFISLAAPDWFWSELIQGDLSHSAVFDNSKIRTFVPGFSPRWTFHQSVREMVRWRSEHESQSRVDPEVDRIMDRLVTGYERARKVFGSLAPTGQGRRTPQTER